MIEKSVITFCPRLLMKVRQTGIPKNITLSHFNINSLRNKFILIKKLRKSKLDFFLVFETKINHSFPNQQLRIDRYKIYCRDRNSFGGGLLFSSIILKNRYTLKKSYRHKEVIAVLK